jgi:hypothetical protein
MVLRIGRRGFLGGALALPVAGCCFGGGDGYVSPPIAAPTPAPMPSAAPIAPAAPPALWSPAQTVVFAAGLLRWARHDLYGSFPRVERRDRALIDTLVGRGVPRERITYLHDHEATLAAARTALRASIDAAGPEDTFLFYWTGHGDRTESGASFAVTYDAGDDSTTSCLAYDEIVRTIEQHGRMRQAMLFADTCYSGAIADDATARTGGPPRAGFGSSGASETSTGNWTFTDAIIAAFGGAANADRDRDRAVTVADLSRFIEEEMAFADGQLATMRHTADFPAVMQLAQAEAAPCARYGERIEVLQEGTWWPATITGQPGDQLAVHYDGYTHRWDATVDANETRPYAPTTYAPGTRVSVRWNDAWYPATVREQRLGVHFVHYDDYAETWDEWVSIDRVRTS